MSVYLIQSEELIGSNVYKIGMTCRNNFNRVLSYGKNAKIISTNNVNNPKYIEKCLINEFKKNLH